MATKAVMTRDWKYILYISLAAGTFLVLKLLSPKLHDWTITFSAEDKNPFGGYALNEIVRTLFPGSDLHHSFKTLYELRDSIPDGSNVFIVSERFSPGREDVMTLLDHVQRGGSAFISAQYIRGALADTLGIGTYDANFKLGNVLSRYDTSYLQLTTASLDTSSRYAYKSDNIHNYFNHFDTARTSVVAVNQYRMPVTIRMKWGEGNLILNSTPIIFTNICLLARDNAAFAAAQLSYLPDRPLMWTEYYQRGRREIATPLRFILRNEPLRWAYYISIVSLLVFMIFEMKRKQRIIPVIPPLTNTTLEFVSTIGELYYQNGDHKNIAEKKINFFLEQVRSRHAIATNQLDAAFVASLAKKTGQTEERMTALVRLIAKIKESAGISAETLTDLNTQIEAFNIQQK